MKAMNAANDGNSNGSSAQATLARINKQTESVKQQHEDLKSRRADAQRQLEEANAGIVAGTPGAADEAVRARAVIEALDAAKEPITAQLQELFAQLADLRKQVEIERRLKPFESEIAGLQVRVDTMEQQRATIEAKAPATGPEASAAHAFICGINESLRVLRPQLENLKRTQALLLSLDGNEADKAEGAS